METTGITAGTDKIFHELRNMPCPHLSVSGVICTLGGVGQLCKEDSVAGCCPVIEALLIYIPWKRDMIAEEIGMDPGEFMQQMQEFMYDPTNESLVESRGIEEEEEKDVDGNTYIYGGDVTIFGIRMQEDCYYKITKKDINEPYIGSFIDLINGNTLRMTENPGLIITIHLVNIEKIEQLTFQEVSEYYSKGICGVDMVKNSCYTIYSDNNARGKYTGEFLHADSTHIRMFANSEQERFRIEDITKVELL